MTPTPESLDLAQARFGDLPGPVVLAIARELDAVQQPLRDMRVYLEAVVDNHRYENDRLRARVAELEKENTDLAETSHRMGASAHAFEAEVETLRRERDSLKDLLRRAEYGYPWPQPGEIDAALAPQAPKP